MATLLPNGKQQFIDINGDPLVGGFVYFYIPNTLVFKNTWQNSEQTILNTNPVVLDARGQAVIFGDGVYRQIVTDADGNLIWDQLTGSTEATLYAGAATGSSDVIVLTLSPPLTAYVDGIIIEFKAIADNATTTPTVNINTLGAKLIVFPDNTELYAGAIKNGGIYQIAYNATTARFQLLGVSRGSAGNENLNADIVDNGSGSLTANNLSTVKTTNYTYVDADRNRAVRWLISANVTATLPSAVTVGNGWRTSVINDASSTANLTVTATAGLFYGGSMNGVTSFQLSPGESFIATSNGALWIVGALVKLSSTVQGGFKNLNIATADGATANTVTVDQLVVQNASGDAILLRSVNNTTTIDTGSIASNRWYYIWIFFNPTSGNVLARYSLSATAPSLPSGYTYSARIGAARTKSGSAVFLGTIQYGEYAQYTTPPVPVLGSGNVGNVTTPTWVAVPVANFVPTTAGRIFGYSGSAGTGLIVAPNNSYGGSTSAANKPPLILTSGNTAAMFNFTLESANIYWASSAANDYIACMGWIDNL